MGIDFFTTVRRHYPEQSCERRVMARAGKPLEQRGDSHHRKKEVVAAFGKRREIEVPIETKCVIVNCVHDKCGRSDLRGLQISPMQGVNRQEPAQPPALVHPIDGKAPKQRRGY